MAIPRWRPVRQLSRREELILKHARRVRKLFVFLREVRHELFDDSFQGELEEMYRGTGAGKVPIPPALMAMAVLVQGYVGASDAEAVELTVVDLRWQVVLGRLGEEEPAFSQGALHDFRHRLIRHDMDRRLLERTRELAEKSGLFDAKKLPRSLRVGIDSMPLEGAGRVEDSVNLLGHAARKLVEALAGTLELDFEHICRDAGVPLLLASSIKRGLDCDWTDPEQKTRALNRLISELDSLQRWMKKNAVGKLKEIPAEVAECLATLQQLLEQDLEPDPSGGGGKPRMRIRQGVAADRRVSIEDPEMRHGRKSKSKRFNGYKRHIAADLDSGLVVACAVTPANVAEERATEPLRRDIAEQGLKIRELYIDRAYINSELAQTVLARTAVFCKPWRQHNTRGKLFSKSDFHLDLRRHTITCPGGETERFEAGQVVEFDPEACGRCKLRSQCTMANEANGRMVSMSEDEALQKRLRKLVASPPGRSTLRRRVGVEHRLAHIAQRQGRRARYLGVRNNLFDLRRAAAIQNLETVHREYATAA